MQSGWQGVKEPGVRLKTAVLMRGNELDEIRLVHLVLIGKDPAAHFVEENIGKVMGRHDPIGGDLQTICGGNDPLKGLRIRFDIPLDLLPIAAGRVTFIRQVTPNGNLHLLGLTFKVGKLLKGQCVKVTIDTQHAQLNVYVQGRIFKCWPYPYMKP